MHKNAIKKTGGSFFDTKVGIFYKNVANLRNILEWRFVAIFDSRGGDFVLKHSGHTANSSENFDFGKNNFVQGKKIRVLVIL